MIQIDAEASARELLYRRHGFKVKNFVNYMVV